MGGLEALSCGCVREAIFGLEVYQTQALSKRHSGEALDALQETGVEADTRLRPLVNGAPQFENLFVTGATLAHWHPTREASTEGVALATGWSAAEEAIRLLEA
jgi:anaerobic glycerol-3-phosphate dehydrogenase